jgi:hypothetical protein
MTQQLNKYLRPGVIVHTMTMGRVRVKELNGDEVLCQVVGGKGQIILSRIAATRRIIETAKGAKK